MIKLGTGTEGGIEFENPKNIECVCTVGNYSAICRNCKIIVDKKANVSIGSDVFINEGVAIYSGVTIGNCVIIGKLCDITTDIPDYSEVIRYGNNVKIVQRYTPIVRSFLNDIEWWNWSTDKINSNKQFFSQCLNKLDPIYNILSFDIMDYSFNLNKIKNQLKDA